MRKCGIPICNNVITKTGNNKYCKTHKDAPQLRKKIWRAQNRAEEKGLEFDITIADIDKIFPYSMICPAIGILMSYGDASGRYFSPSLDRIDNSKGYTIDNIQIITHQTCLLYTSPSPRDRQKSRMPSSA